MPLKGWIRIKYYSVCIENGLNPCFIGYYTWISIKSGELLKKSTVLILVLLDITRG